MMSMTEQLKHFLKTDGGRSVKEYAFVCSAAIPFSADVRRACEVNLCGRYGKSWTCPPGAGEWEALRDAYRQYPNALVYSTCHPIEDSFDFEGMEDGRQAHDAQDEALLDLLGESASVVLLGAGSCTLCESCTYPHAPCRQPQRARRSMEACGIDVVALSRALGMRYMNGANTVTYFSVLFYHDAALE